ncbi:MAG: hypothetical protein U0414_42535 [Polyangiaceae bacterium]
MSGPRHATASALVVGPAEPAGVTIVQSQTVIAPRPLIASEANCTDVVGLEPRAFRRALRLLEVPTITTPDGVAALVADLEAALRERGKVLESEPPRQRPKKAAPANDDGQLEGASDWGCTKKAGGAR